MTGTPVRILSIVPFWRYAVGPTSASHPAIPACSRRQADRLFNEIVAELPWAGCVMYRRRWFSKTVDVVKEYRP